MKNKILKNSICGFDFETFLIEGCESPQPVCLSWDDGETRGVVAGMDDMYDKLVEMFDRSLSDRKHLLVAHNTKFELGVIFSHFPELRSDIFELLSRGQFRDTMIREQLLELSTSGRINGKQYTHAALTKTYQGIDISASKTEDSWRLRYGELWGKLIEEYPKEAYDYSLADSTQCRTNYIAQEIRKRPDGYGSIGTDTLQVKSDFCLQLITQRGIEINLDRLASVKTSAVEQLIPTKKFMLDCGLAQLKTTKGVTKLVKKRGVLQKHIADSFPDTIRLTEGGAAKLKKKYQVSESQAIDAFNAGLLTCEEELKDFYSSIATAGDFLEELANTPMIEAWKDYMFLEKAISTYIPRMEQSRVLYPPYRNLKETGRTSSYVSKSFPSLNIQQIPRKGNFRECFVPRKGMTFGVIDYASIELSCVAQALTDLGIPSQILKLINSGDKPIDMHAYVGCALYCNDNGRPFDFEMFCALKKTDPKTYKRYRTAGKPIGLGYFGGLGHKTMRMVSRSQGAPLTEDEAIEGRKIHANIFPEIIDYLGWRKCRDGMSHPKKGQGGWVRDQQIDPDSKYGYAYQVNGRYRAGCTYCSCANGRAMQSLAADGAKEAIFLTTRACYDPEFMGGQFNDCYPVWFIHDEIGFEIPKGSMAKLKMRGLERLMIQGMQVVLPKVRVAVEGCLMDFWSKDDSHASHVEKVWCEPGGSEVLVV